MQFIIWIVLIKSFSKNIQVIQTLRVSVVIINHIQLILQMGIKDLCITSDGKKYENPKTIKKYEKKLTKLQRQLAGKTKGSGKYQKVGCEVSEAGSP